MSSLPQKKVTVIRADSGTRDSRLQKELRMFVEAGFETTLLCWDRAREHAKTEEKDGYSVRRCHLPAPYGSKWLFLMTPLWYVYELLYLLFHRADCIHSCDFDTLPPALLCKWIKGTKVVYDIYDFYAARTRSIPHVLRGLFLRAEQSCARRANAVVIVDAAREYLFGKRPPKRRVVAMNCPYDVVKPDWRKKDAGPFTIFYGGLIAKHRGIRKLARVTAGIDNVRVVVAGWITDDSYRKILEESPNIDYIGMVSYDDALRLTYEADAVYSYYDPALEINRTANSSKMFDAFMCSTPVLANSEPPMAGVIADHACGACIPYEDEDALRDTITRWRDAPNRARGLGRNGRTLFEESLNWPTMGEKILNLYREIGVLA